MKQCYVFEIKMINTYDVVEGLIKRLYRHMAIRWSGCGFAIATLCGLCCYELLDLLDP